MRQLTLDKLSELFLRGMRRELALQDENPKIAALPFEDRLLRLLDAEDLERKERSLAYKLRSAGLRQSARMEELDFRASRTLDRGLLDELAEGRWIREKRNVILTGPTGIGKTFLACALAHRACEHRRTARYFRVPKLLGDLAIARAQGTHRTKLAALARADLLVLDDWMVQPLTADERRDLLEILDDRYDRRSTLVCAQLPIPDWHNAIGDPTIADAMLDRLVHNAYRLEIQGESMRKAKALAQDSGGIIDPPENPGS
jgi:DNA replication protein DnaC